MGIGILITAVIGCVAGFVLEVLVLNKHHISAGHGVEILGAGATGAIIFCVIYVAVRRLF